MASVRNIFSLGRRAGAEDQLTEMLIWLIEAVPQVGEAIVRLAFESDQDASSMKVTTQHGVVGGRLDALFVGPSFALIVESKLGSGYGEDQIAKYLRWLVDAHGHRDRRALMTLTAHEAPWSTEDRSLATDLGVRGSARRWEELHAVLQPLAEEADRELSGRLVREFLDMLSKEDLIPMQPFAQDELTAWRDAGRTVERFHKFFRACKEEIGGRLDAKASSNAWSEKPGYTWQDYLFDNGTKIVVGLQDSDEELVPRHTVRHAPIAWMAVEAKEWADWSEAKERLEATPPAGWNLNPNRWWGERPIVWRYFDEIVGNGSFEEQRGRLAAAYSAGGAWLRAARQGADRP